MSTTTPATQPRPEGDSMSSTDTQPLVVTVYVVTVSYGLIPETVVFTSTREAAEWVKGEMRGVGLDRATRMEDIPQFLAADWDDWELRWHTTDLTIKGE